MHRVFCNRQTLAIPQPPSPRLGGGRMNCGGVMVNLIEGTEVPGFVTCRYGASRAVFRGPAQDLSRPYIAFLGGAVTLGKGLAHPFAELVERALGLPAVNLGASGAGPDFYLADRGVLEVAARARLAVVQLPGADALSNPFYSVHRRRNDRFLATTPALRALFPEVDFSDIHFTGHLLRTLSQTDDQRFAVVRNALRATWLSRMELLLDHLPPQRLLLWLTDCPTDTAATDGVVGRVTQLVDADMLKALRPAASGCVIVRCEPLAAPRQPAAEICRIAEACTLPGPDVHARIAADLVRRIAPLLSGKPAPLMLEGRVRTG